MATASPGSEPMSPDVRAECFRLKCKSKRGIELTPKESALLQKWRRTHREEFVAMERDVFEATKPYGA